METNETERRLATIRQRITLIQNTLWDLEDQAEITRGMCRRLKLDEARELGPLKEQMRRMLVQLDEAKKILAAREKTIGAVPATGVTERLANGVADVPT